MSETVPVRRDDPGSDDQPGQSTGPAPAASPSWLARLRRLIFGSFASAEDDFRETLEEFLDDSSPLTADQFSIGASERTMLSNILKLRDMMAEDVAVPRTDIIAAEADLSFRDVLALLNDQGHSRVPVYDGSLDNVIGFIHLKDLLPFIGREDDFSLRDLLRQPLFVSPAMAVNDLLLDMRERRIHMALVVDEFGGTDGLITIEDLVEQIVGEIEDETDSDDEEPELVSVSGEWLADARLTIEDFEERFGPVLSEADREEDIDTLGGLLFMLAGRVPVRGEVLTHSESGFEFRVTDADPRRIKRLMIRPPSGWTDG